MKEQEALKKTYEHKFESLQQELHFQKQQRGLDTENQGYETKATTNELNHLRKKLESEAE